MPETSTKPYLIRAIHAWCTDFGYTPYVAVAVGPGVAVPAQNVNNGEIVLNLSALATNRLQIDNQAIAFQARFGGVAREVYVPIDAVLAIYARENGQGMAFEVARAADGTGAPSAPSGTAGETGATGQAPSTAGALATVGALAGAAPPARLLETQLRLASDRPAADQPGDPDDPAPPPDRPRLKRVK